MATRQEIRSEETRQAILTAASQLFASHGYDAVTMREIAKEAGCSHTTIYIYFKDKEALLSQLSMGPLRSLRDQLEAVLKDGALPPDQRLAQVSQTFIHFSLANRSMYGLFFMAEAERVDLPDSKREITALRNHLFGLLKRAVADCLTPGLSDEQILAYGRIYFFALHGIISTYNASVEPLEVLLERLGPTFDLTFTVLLAGFRETAQKGAI